MLSPGVPLKPSVLFFEKNIILPDGQDDPNNYSKKQHWQYIWCINLPSTQVARLAVSCLCLNCSKCNLGCELRNLRTTAYVKCINLWCVLLCLPWECPQQDHQGADFWCKNKFSLFEPGQGPCPALKFSEWRRKPQASVTRGLYRKKFTNSRLHVVAFQDWKGELRVR